MSSLGSHTLSYTIVTHISCQPTFSPRHLSTSLPGLMLAISSIFIHMKRTIGNPGGTLVNGSAKPSLLYIIINLNLENMS